MVSEGDEREVGGEGIPPGDEGRVSQSVPEDAHPLLFSPKHINTNIEAFDTTQDPRVHLVIRSVTSLTAFYKQAFVFY